MSILDDAFPELSLDKLSLGGSPIPLRTLEIILMVKHDLDRPRTVPGPSLFNPHLQLLNLSNPVELRISEPLKWRSNRDLVTPRSTVHITRAAADTICGWTRLRKVTLIDLDFYVTPHDQPLRTPAERELFLHRRVPGPSPSITVTWVLSAPAAETTEEQADQEESRFLEPVEYFARRRPLDPAIIKQAFLVLPNDDERAKAKARTDVPALIKILAAVGEEEKA